MDLESKFLFKSEFSRNCRYLIDFHTNIQKIENWLLVSQLYENWLNDKNHDNKFLKKIPKIIHHIWLGSPIPKRYKYFINTWKSKNPEWKFIFWDDNKLNDFEMVNKDLYDRLKNYGAKSDIARLEVLYQMGGFYLDTDFECLNKIDESLLFNDFIAGTAFNFFPELCNAFIAAKPSSRFILKCLTDLKNIKVKNFLEHEIIENTGPLFLTNAFFKYLENKHNNEEKMLVLPSNYFYPLPNYVRNIKLEEVYKYPTNKSIGIHHWEASWNKMTIYDRIKLKLKKFLNKFFLSIKTLQN